MLIPSRHLAVLAACFRFVPRAFPRHVASLLHPRGSEGVVATHYYIYIRQAFLVSGSAAVCALPTSRLARHFRGGLRREKILARNFHGGLRREKILARDFRGGLRRSELRKREWHELADAVHGVHPFSAVKQNADG